MAAFTSSHHTILPDGTAETQEPSRRTGSRDGSRLGNRALGMLEAWLDMRTRRERARLDAVMAHDAHATLHEERARTAWWRSWRARKRKRG